MRAFDADHPVMTLSEVASATGLSRAAARRFLLTLVELGYMRSDGRRFSLTPQVLTLGTAYLSSLGLPDVAQPHLERLSQEVGESTSVAVLDGTEVVYVARVAKRAIMTVGISVGTRFPAHATSLGRVLLASLDEAALTRYFAEADLTAPSGRRATDESALRAELERARSQGWAATDEALAPGLRSVAAPLRDSSGTVVAAVNVSSTTAHQPAAEYLDSLLACAAAISDDLRAQG